MNLLLFKFLSQRTTKSKSDTKPFIIQNLLCTSKANTCNIYLYRLGNVRLISLILCSKTEDYSRIGTNKYLTLRVIWRFQGPFLKPKGYVSLRFRVQNRRTKWNFPLYFRTMRKLSELYFGIFQTQSSGCVSGLDHFRNFRNLKILNI